MRVITLLAVLSPALAVTAGAAPPLPPAAHDVTCATPRVSREYQSGLQNLYLGKLDAAARDFREAIRDDPACAMAHWGLSRVLQRAGRAPDAAAEAAKAEELAVNADERERKLISAWAKYLKSLDQPEPERKKTQDAARRDLTTVITLYPEDPEAWLLRGLIAESPLRAAPFFLAALHLQPGHPFVRTWQPQAPPPPSLTPKQTQPVAETAQPQLFDGLGLLSYPITTSSLQARAYFEQGLRCYDAYVTPGRVRNGAGVCFRYAANLDPECAMAYWGLSFCEGSGISAGDAANRALELALKNGTDKERRMCAARVMETEWRELRGKAQSLRGQAGRSKGADSERARADAEAADRAAERRRDEFWDALDGAIVAYPDDVELWIWRGKSYGSYGEGDEVPAASMLYQLAAHRMHPEHPSPNHELIHAYEGINRPALGWPYTVGFRESAPNMPHANHMQAHLAMRLGRWQEAIDCTRASRRKSLEGYPELDPAHHIDVMIRALGHAGRFQEADREPKAYRDGLPWARLLQLKADLPALEQWAERRGSAGGPEGAYVAAIVKLDRGDLEGALPFIAKVEQRWRQVPSDIYQYNEVQGRYLVQSGKADEGLKLLRAAAQKALKDYGLHAWGGGSYMMEVWGETAMRTHRWDEAEEAFHEALAHEHGSVIAALGMQVLWEQRGRTDMAGHYAARAASIWKDADPGALDRQLARIRGLPAASAAVSGVN